MRPGRRIPLRWTAGPESEDAVLLAALILMVFFSVDEFKICVFVNSVDMRDCDHQEEHFVLMVIYGAIHGIMCCVLNNTPFFILVRTTFCIQHSAKFTTDPRGSSSLNYALLVFK
jgi:hypothetical protein